MKNIYNLLTDLAVLVVVETVRTLAETRAVDSTEVAVVVVVAVAPAVEMVAVAVVIDSMTILFYFIFKKSSSKI